MSVWISLLHDSLLSMLTSPLERCAAASLSPFLVISSCQGLLSSSYSPCQKKKKESLCIHVGGTSCLSWLLPLASPPTINLTPKTNPFKTAVSNPIPAVSQSSPSSPSLPPLSSGPAAPRSKNPKHQGHRTQTNMTQRGPALCDNG